MNVNFKIKWGIHMANLLLISIIHMYKLYSPEKQEYQKNADPHFVQFNNSIISFGTLICFIKIIFFQLRLHIFM